MSETDSTLDSPPSRMPLPAPPELNGLKPRDLFARALQPERRSDGRWQPPAPKELARLLPQYRIELLLGRGGMGAVYRGLQESLHRPVAIKILPTEMAADPNFVARFQREARTLAKLQHPGIIAVYGFGQTSEGHLYFVTEFVDGTDLAHVIRSTPLSAAQAVEVTLQICDALHYAHAEGVIHRDIKPANILMTRDGRAKLGDFGLARPVFSEDLSALTISGAVMGTPAYMAPEQREGRADHRSDIYALGVLLYELLTGRRPEGVFERPSTRANSDARLDEVVIKAMQHDPQQRYQEVSEMRAEIAEIRTTPAPEARAVVLVPMETPQAEAATGQITIRRNVLVAAAVVAAALVIASLATSVFLFAEINGRRAALADPPVSPTPAGTVTEAQPRGVVPEAAAKLTPAPPRATPAGAATPDNRHRISVIDPPNYAPGSSDAKVRDLSQQIKEALTPPAAPATPRPKGEVAGAPSPAPTDQSTPVRNSDPRRTFGFGLRERGTIRKISITAGIPGQANTILPDGTSLQVTEQGGRITLSSSRYVLQLVSSATANRRAEIGKGDLLQLWAPKRKQTVHILDCLEAPPEGLLIPVSASPTASPGGSASPGSQDVALAPTSPDPGLNGASRDAPWENSLGMKFVPVPGTNIFMCIHETRRADYAAYAGANPAADRSWMTAEKDGVLVSDGDAHPVVKVNWEDAKAFCEWLTKNEGRSYRLPIDREWSQAVGIGDREETTATPATLSNGNLELNPWGTEWPPPKGAGNYADSTFVEKFFPGQTIEGTGYSAMDYTDGYATTAPVMSFAPNKLGLYDLGGNVWEWCEDWFSATQKTRVTRGGSWGNSKRTHIVSSRRHNHGPNSRSVIGGFRCVVEARK